MDGFKNSTKTQYSMGGSAYAKGGSVKGAAKVAKVMGEFKSGELHSGSKSGPAVTNPKQAIAISLSEARKAGAKVMKKDVGGAVVDPRQAGMADRMAARDARQDARMAARDVRQDARQDARADRMAARDARMAVRDPQQNAPGISGATPVIVAAKKGGRIMKKDEGGSVTNGAVARGNRMSAEEAGEDRVIDRRRASTAEPDYSRMRNYDSPEGKAKASELTIRLSKRGPAGMRHDDRPLLDRVVETARSALGLKKGGLAAMPRGKK